VEASQGSAAVEVLKALGDPVRWSIVAQIAAVDELPCADLERTLPVSKSTISYHTKTLQQAGLLSVRKEGRNYYYALRRDVLRVVQDELWRLAPGPRPVAESGVALEAVGYDGAAVPGRRRRAAGQGLGVRRPRRAAGDDDVVVLTW
jgi:DNA-binding transcriptional ArsR family regulator